MRAYHAPARGVRLLHLDGRCLLFSEGRQQVLELNETAQRIWRGLVTAGSLSEAAGELADLGLERREALRLTREAAAQWVHDGLLAPGAQLGRRGPVVALDHLVVEIEASARDLAELKPVFGHLYAERDGPRRRLRIHRQAGELLLYVDGALAMAGAPDGLAAHVKAALTELYADTVEDGFLTHGALLLHRDRRVLLSGAPGAGKTTLTLALAAAGWSYGGDDIVRISPDGSARGVPFAATVKAGSLPLLREAWPQLARTAAWLRGDGQQARYLLPAQRALGPAAPLDAVVVLARKAGAAARARPITAVQALSVILEGAYARRWRMDGEALSALAATLERAACVELEYSDLGPAVQVLAELADLRASAA